MWDSLAAEIARDIKLGHPVRSMRGKADTLSEAYLIQDALRSKIGPICGRKIAMNSPMLMALAGISEPIVGLMLGTAPLGTGAKINMSDYAELALEPEFAAVLGRDVPVGTTLNSDNLMDYIAHFSLSFELLDKREDPGDFHAPTFVANNVFNAGCVLADQKLDAAALWAGEYSTEFSAFGVPIMEGHTTAPQNPIEACAFVINHFTHRGDVVSAGEVILCGAHHPPMVIEEEGMYRFSLSTGEAVSLSISA